MYRPLSISVTPAFFVITTLFLVACGEGGGIPPRPLPIDATAAEVYAASVDAMSDVTSYRWVTDIETVETGETSTLHIEGVWADDQSYDFVATSDRKRGSVEAHFRVVHGRWFFEDEDVWREMPGPQPLGVPRFRGNSELVDLDNIDFSRNVTSAALYQLVGDGAGDIESFGSFQLVVRLAIDHQDLRLASSDATVTYGPGTVQRQTTRFSRYNEPVKIELPENRIDLPDPVNPGATLRPRPTSAP